MSGLSNPKVCGEVKIVLHFLLVTALLDALGKLVYIQSQVPSNLYIKSLVELICTKQAVMELPEFALLVGAISRFSCRD